MAFGSGHGSRLPARSKSGPAADPESVARAIVLGRLTTTPRTRAQLAEDLRRRNVADDVAKRVLDRFGEVGLVDDDAFAQMWVRSRHEGRGLARRALGHELRQRGVDDETVARAVDEVDDADEAAAAAALVSRRLPSTRGLAREVRIRRLVGMLARKGYAGVLAMRVVRAALAAETGDEDMATDMATDWADDQLPKADRSGRQLKLGGQRTPKTSPRGRLEGPRTG